MVGDNGQSVRELFRASARRVQTYERPGFGPFTVRSLTEGERARNEARFLDKDGVYDRRLAYLQRPSLIVLMSSTEDGKQLLPQSAEKDVMEMDAGLTAAMYEACLEHLGSYSVDDAKKNSSETPSAASPTA